MPTDPQHEQASLQQLQKIHHDRRMGDLATDVYVADKGMDKPPAGWIRASEHPELLNQYAPQLHMTAFELRRALHPDESGFRAEIYLPDAKVLGPGYESVVAFKGSSGDVKTSDGRQHDTTKEDFLANNFPQSVGMETDYYDRAMKLASDLKAGGLRFELTGHSLAGGMASAASAVTGNPATTFNAAGLHPETARRFGEQNHLPVYNNEQLKPLVTAYQVQGELLSDGIQGNVHRMDVIQRAEVGGLLKETSQLVNELPQGRELLKQQMGRDMPPQAQATVRAFVDKVANGPTDHMLRELPLAAGTVEPVLAPMTHRNPDDPTSPLVHRAQEFSLPEIVTLGGPVLETLSIAAASAHVGHRAGEAVAYSGHVAGQAFHDTGTGARGVAEFGGQAQRIVTQAEGAVVQKTEHYAGALATRTVDIDSKLVGGAGDALGRTQQWGASMEASLMRDVGHVLPAGPQTWVNEQAARVEHNGQDIRHDIHAKADEIRREGAAGASAIRGATHTLEKGTGQAAGHMGDLQHDATAGMGRLAGGTLDATGQIVESKTRQAPVAGAGLGALLGVSAAAALELQPANYPRLAEAATAIAHGKPALTEAVGRHLMKPSVLPSLDARIDELEKAARHAQEQKHGPEPGAKAPAAVHAPATAESARPNDPRHPDHPQHAQYEKVSGLVADAYGKHGMALHPEQLERVTAQVMLDAHKRPMNPIQEVRLNGDPGTHRVHADSHVMAFSGDPHAVTSLRYITDVQQARQTPPEQTFQQLGQLQEKQAQVAMQQTQTPTIHGPGGPGMGGPGGR